MQKYKLYGIINRYIKSIVFYEAVFFFLYGFICIINLEKVFFKDDYNREMEEYYVAEEKQSNYGAEQIQVLEGLEAVRKRPGMYIGTTSSDGLHHLVYEIVDNSIDEALAGYCTEVHICLHKDGSVSVHDNGRGFPVGIHPKLGRPAVEQHPCAAEPENEKVINSAN